MSKTRAFCGVCGYSAPMRSGGKVGRHYLYSGNIQYLCQGSGELETETHGFPLLGSNAKILVEGKSERRGLG